MGWTLILLAVMGIGYSYARGLVQPAPDSVAWSWPEEDENA